MAANATRITPSWMSARTRSVRVWATKISRINVATAATTRTGSGGPWWVIWAFILTVYVPKLGLGRAFGHICKRPIVSRVDPAYARCCVRSRIGRMAVQLGQHRLVVSDDMFDVAQRDVISERVAANVCFARCDKRR